MSKCTDVDFSNFIRCHKRIAFQSSIYVGETLANPLITGEGKKENLATALAAFEMAKRVAEVTGDSSYLCLAIVHRVIVIG